MKEKVREHRLDDNRRIKGFQAVLRQAIIIILLFHVLDGTDMKTYNVENGLIFQ